MSANAPAAIDPVPSALSVLETIEADAAARWAESAALILEALGHEPAEAA